MYTLNFNLASLKNKFRISFLWISFGILFGCSLSGCDTGFGEPCTLPQTSQFRESCQQSAIARSDDENNPEQEFKATCAVDNFPTCQTFSCLTYRGSSSYCSMQCDSNADCPNGCCCPLFGDCDCSNQAMMSIDPNAIASPASTALEGPKYCIRKVDLTQ